MSKLGLVFLIISVILVTNGLASRDRSELAKRNRFSPLSFFNIVAWPNEECQVTEDGHVTNGTCYSRSECRQLGGEAKGECADGYGVCCLFQFSCGNVSNANISYFVNPRWPQHFNEPSSCTLKVNKVNNQICQIRLDFQEFDILGPTEFRPLVNLKQTGSSFGSINTESNCKEDLFVVTQTNRNQPIPIICGHNQGQHLYIPVETSDSEMIALTFLTGINEYNRKWKIKITQLPCSLSQEILAPQGCLQYYTSPKGFIKTFNFEGRRYIQNIDYSICIRKPKNMCYLTFNAVKYIAPTTPQGTAPTTIATTAPTPASSTLPIESSSTMSGEEMAVPSPVFPFSNDSLRMGGRFSRFAGDDFCFHDGYWITWPGSNRICSSDIEVLESPVTISTNAPEVIHFHSLTWSQALQFNVNKFTSAKGFAISYAHAPCTHGFL